MSNRTSAAPLPDEVLDLVCVGFGPANIALAVAFDELWPSARVLFLERERGARWQPGMLLSRSDIQNNPARDLVTPRNPRSRYTFVNYLHENNRLFKHLNVPAHHPLRKEFAKYVQWVAEQVPADVRYGHEVTSVGIVEDGGRGLVEVRTADGQLVRARAAVVAPGRTANIPAAFADIDPRNAFHTNHYLPGIADLDRDFAGTIAVVGGSQSAIEVVLDLADRFPAARVANVMSGYGYRLKDTSPFSEEVYFPEFVSYYHAASPQGKHLLREQLRPTNYSSADRDVIDALYLRLYEDDLDGAQRITLHTNRIIESVVERGGRVALDCLERVDGSREVITADRVVLATGFRDLGTGKRAETLPPLLADLVPALRVDAETGVRVGLDYRLATTDPQAPPIFLNGLCESSHGLGDAGSFSLLALRAKAILHSARRALTTGAAVDDADLIAAPTR
ncbi:L-ornithine N5-oxygenase [Actinokineospora baliensis]|uniref:lysine N(6)-hydroxylase/L-ornithine N(5)-oxygenase family protein n=1 Tax=Actinokineospora baliensis TaxID=547056 RepID=UPI00195E10AC|nr:SidA/IucD/PvdA family monooxygenase [Actinokineospora baliensis]MBM7773848.1 L-ornithine N5-oxygenase [Actinokineospora baliensis]